MANYLWSITGITTIPHPAPLEGFISHIDWNCYDPESENPEGISGSLDFDYDERKTYLPEAEVRNDPAMLDWVFAVIDKAAIEARL